MGHCDPWPRDCESSRTMAVECAERPGARATASACPARVSEPSGGIRIQVNREVTGSAGGGSPHVVIVGGGFCGLAAAYELGLHGIRATVLERDADLGGLAGGFRAGGTRLEKFYHHWFTSDVAHHAAHRGAGRSGQAAAAGHPNRDLPCAWLLQALYPDRSDPLLAVVVPRPHPAGDDGPARASREGLAQPRRPFRLRLASGDRGGAGLQGRLGAAVAWEVRRSGGGGRRGLVLEQAEAARWKPRQGRGGTACLLRRWVRRARRSARASDSRAGRRGQDSFSGDGARGAGRTGGGGHHRGDHARRRCGDRDPGAPDRRRFS